MTLDRRSVSHRIAGIERRSTRMASAVAPTDRSLRWPRHRLPQRAKES
jgi:hypothetical protein